MSSLPLLAGAATTWGSFVLSQSGNGPDKDFSKLLILHLPHRGIYKKSVISQGTNICHWSCSHPEYLPNQGTRVYHWGYPNSLVFYFGNRLCYLKASSPRNCLLLPVVARSQLSPSLTTCTSQTCCFVADSGCEKGQELPGQCSRKGCLDQWCYQTLNRRWEGAQGLDQII